MMRGQKMSSFIHETYPTALVLDAAKCCCSQISETRLALDIYLFCLSRRCFGAI